MQTDWEETVESRAEESTITETANALITQISRLERISLQVVQELDKSINIFLPCHENQTMLTSYQLNTLGTSNLPNHLLLREALHDRHPILKPKSKTVQSSPTNLQKRSELRG